MDLNNLKAVVALGGLPTWLECYDLVALAERQEAELAERYTQELITIGHITINPGVSMEGVIDTARRLYAERCEFERLFRAEVAKRPEQAAHTARAVAAAIKAHAADWTIGDPHGAVEMLRAAAQELLDVAAREVGIDDDTDLSRATSKVDNALAACVGYVPVVAPASVEKVDALTDERAVEMFGEEFGLQQFEDIADEQIISFVSRVIAASQPAAPVQPTMADLRSALAGLHKVCQIALAGKDFMQHAYFETRAGSFVLAVDAMKAAEVALAAPVQAAPEGWIRTVDRMPDDGAEVVVIGPAYNNYGKGTYADKALFRNGNFYDEDGAEFHPPGHWMALPADPMPAGSAT